MVLVTSLGAKRTEFNAGKRARERMVWGFGGLGVCDVFLFWFSVFFFFFNFQRFVCFFWFLFCVCLVFGVFGTSFGGRRWASEMKVLRSVFLNEIAELETTLWLFGAILPDASVAKVLGV